MLRVLTGALVAIVVACQHQPRAVSISTSPRVIGVVLDSTTAKPIESVFIFVVGASQSVLSDSAGRFQIDSMNVAIPGATLIARKIGYYPDSAQIAPVANAADTVVFRLRRNPARIEGK